MLLVFIFILYCCIACSTTYDKEIDDIEQEKFIQEWKKETMRP